MKVYRGELVRVLEENLLERMLRQEEITICPKSLNDYEKEERNTICYNLGEVWFTVEPPLKDYAYYKLEKCDNIRT